MEKLSKEFYMINDELISTENLDIFNDLSGKGIYEVIKVQDNVPMFLEEHIERLFDSIKALGYSYEFDYKEIKEKIDFIISKNTYGDRNLKIIYSKLKNKEYALLIFFVDTKFPDEVLYKDGIKTVTMNLQREDPNIKIQRNWYKEKVSKYLEEKNAYEALLIDDNHDITEGSRSNIFYVIDGKVITTEGKKVLLGITRKYILNIINELGYELINKTININELSEIDGAIMTGTGVGVLPIKEINDIKINSKNNSIVSEITNKYIEKEVKYIENYNK